MSTTDNKSPSHPAPRLLDVCKSSAALVDKYLAMSAEGSSVRKSTQSQVRKSISIIQQVLESHSLHEIAISFNGGKDCLVMLIIFLATLYYRYTDLCARGLPTVIQNFTSIPSVYVHSDCSFPEIEEFVKECNTKYCLDTLPLNLPLKEAFATYLADRPYIKTILAGIRRADPFGDTLDYVQQTDHGWPKFLRVHPVLEWHFVEVWDFLRALEIPYCCLYDQGYTSLGGRNNTAKNPCLETEKTDDQGNPVYLPAYILCDDDKERMGRLQ